jgi:uncharacterized membrane protein YesL
MNTFFNPDGPLMETLGRIGKLIAATALWLLCCIPIITIIPATTSFYYTVIKSIRRERGYTAQEFFHSIKRTLPKGILFSVLLLLWGAALWYGRQFAIANDTESFNVLLFAYDVLIALTAIVTTCLIPVFSRFEMPTTALIKLAFVMAIRYLYYTIPLAVGTVFIGWLLIMKLPMLCILILPGLWCYAATYPVEKMLLAYMPREDTGSTNRSVDAWYRETDERRESIEHKIRKKLAQRKPNAIHSMKKS